MDNNNNGNAGIGFMGFLALVFIALKLCGVITWSWIWVLSPIWISAIIAVVAVIVTVFIMRWLNKD